MAFQLVIQYPGAETRTLSLDAGRITVGRSSGADISFQDDAGLSRLHFAFEGLGDAWTVEDLGSKNGTFVNEVPLRERRALKAGDCVTAGHAAITFAVMSATGQKSDVVVFEGEEPTASGMATVVTSLEASARAVGQGNAYSIRAGGTSPIQALLQAGQSLAENRPLADLFPLILSLATSAVGAERGVLMTLDDGQLVVRAHKGEDFRISTLVRDRAIQERASILVRDAQLDDAYRARMSIVEQNVRTMMAVPLQTRDATIGLIYVDSQHVSRVFTPDDLSLLTVMANVAAIRIENARLAEAEAASRLIQRELAQAAEIQKGMLPSSAPKVEGAELAGFNAPCGAVGGDYYAFFAYGGGRGGVALGDVSGKGMPAALMMTALDARVRALAEEPGDIGAFMTRLNKSTCVNCPGNRFITFFFAVVDASTGELGFSNAGHNPPLVMRSSGDSQWLEGGGPPLGILAAMSYAEMKARLDSGDILAIYSDGVTEAINAADEEFGEDRLLEVLRSNREQPADAIVRAIRSAVTQFAAGRAQSDDITLVVVKRT